MNIYKIFVSYGGGYGDAYIVIADSIEEAKSKMILLFGDYTNYYFVSELKASDKDNTVFIISSE